MKLKTVLVITILILFILTSINVTRAYTVTCSQTLNEIQNAYNYLEKASSLGYNVSKYELMLDKSINYYNPAINLNNNTLCNLSYSLAYNISNNGNLLIKQAHTHYYSLFALNLTYIILFFILSYLFYKFSPTIFWKLWIKTHKDYEVKER